VEICDRHKQALILLDDIPEAEREKEADSDADGEQEEDAEIDI
jgi:hypothetical protein